MSAFQSDPAVRPDPHKPQLWRLLEPLGYYDRTIGQIIIRAGASTDGASIPRLLWSLVGSPMRDSRVFRAAVVHDQLYATCGLGGRLTRAACDAIFHRALIAAGCPALRAAIYWAGVRLGGWIGWQRYARDPGEIQRQLDYIAMEPPNAG